MLKNIKRNISLCGYVLFLTSSKRFAVISKGRSHSENTVAEGTYLEMMLNDQRCNGQDDEQQTAAVLGRAAGRTAVFRSRSRVGSAHFVAVGILADIARAGHSRFVKHSGASRCKA